jgi:hypothetical protein
VVSSEAGYHNRFWYSFFYEVKKDVGEGIQELPSCQLAAQPSATFALQSGTL